MIVHHHSIRMFFSLRVVNMQLIKNFSIRCRPEENPMAWSHSTFELRNIGVSVHATQDTERTQAPLLTLGLYSCNTSDRVFEESKSPHNLLGEDQSPTALIKYNAFWESPNATSLTWLGLLYSIFCLTSQIQSQGDGRSRAQNSASSTWSPTALYTILRYREKVVQCLVQAQFAKGGPDIMETLVHYLLIESYLNKDSNVGVWLLMGNIVQIGTSSC